MTPPLLLILSWLLPTIQAVQTPQPALEVLVKLRTLDSQGQRLAGCRVTLVPADAPRMDPVPRMRPIVVLSNERGLVHARLPAGHAWKVFAWKRGPKGPLATGFLPLADKVTAPDLVLERVSSDKIAVLGLDAWREALPKGLHLQISAWGLPPVRLPLPAAGRQEFELPPLPLGRLWITLEHEKWGRLDTRYFPFFSRERQLRMGARAQDVFRTSLGQPVRLEGVIQNARGQPVAGARIRMVLPGDLEVAWSKWVQSDPQGKYRLWFAWTRVTKRSGVAPELLVTAPGYLLKLEPLLDLCRWITIKTRKRIDPRMLEGLDMARNRILHLNRGHRLDWSVRGHKPTDRFCLRVQVPDHTGTKRGPRSFLLPVQPDAAGRLALPGDLLVQDSKDDLPAFLRGKERASPLELHVVRETNCETLFFRTSGQVLVRQKVFELGKRKPVVFQVLVGGKTVGDARIQIVRGDSGGGLLSPARQVGISGACLRPMAPGDHWVLAESQRRGQALQRIRVDAKSPEKISITLMPWRKVRVLTSHPNPAQAVLPLRYSVWWRFDPTLPDFVHRMLAGDLPGSRGTFAQLRKEYVFQVSPYVTDMSAVLVESPAPPPAGPAPRRPPRPRRGSGTLQLRNAAAPVLEIQWR